MLKEGKMHSLLQKTYSLKGKTDRKTTVYESAITEEKEQAMGTQSSGMHSFIDEYLDIEKYMYQALG